MPPEPAVSTPKSQDVLPEAASSSEPGGQEHRHCTPTSVRGWEPRNTKDASEKAAPDEHTSGADDRFGDAPNYH
eukprot:7173661-Prorocentrum_lima.AAC.1